MTVRVLDYLEALPVHGPEQSLSSVMYTLLAGTPIAIPAAGGWRIVRPFDALAFPGSRQLCDLPSHLLPILAVDEELNVAHIDQHEVWGAIQNHELVGRVDSVRVLRALSKVADDRGSGQALVVEARERLLPKLLHDLANALMVASAVQLDSESVSRAKRAAAGEAVRHARALTMQMRSLYAVNAGPSEVTVDCRALLQRVESMLRVAASPASLSVSWEGRPLLHCQLWRLESVLLNLVLNAGDVASNIIVGAVESPSPRRRRCTATGCRRFGVRLRCSVVGSSWARHHRAAR